MDQDLYKVCSLAHALPKKTAPILSCPPDPLLSSTTQKAGCYKAAGEKENQPLGWRRQQLKEEEEEEEEEATLLQVFISRRGEEGDPILVKVCSKAQVVTAKKKKKDSFCTNSTSLLRWGEWGLGGENNRHFCPFRLGIGRALESNESGMMTLFLSGASCLGKSIFPGHVVK